MKRLNVLFLIIIVGIALYPFLNQKDNGINVSPTIEEKPIPKTAAKEAKAINSTSPSNNVIDSTDDVTLFDYMGVSDNELLKQMGEPVRRDETPYGYTWWIYKKDNQYIQVGVEKGEVVTVYGVGSNISINPYTIGQAYRDISLQLDLKEEVQVSYDGGTYEFHLSKEDLLKRPIVHVDNGQYMQLYFDNFKQELSSVRLLSSRVLLEHRPYEVYYRGELPEKGLILEQDWATIEDGMEKQIFDITNMIRERFSQKQVEWDEKVSSVAYGHSKDMAIHNYFSHISPQGAGLKERLQAKEVQYFSAGENIAAQYPDAPSVVEGWLNSEGHREALLSEVYTHLGVGVYRYYYTQNFLEKPL
ncbi:CAP domain-containing protein [Pontibacillus yanchengensis]|uniref:Membrane protein n=1 Tax=Pontibacillus yanchengensis Y32 TaxID=1385514 RepID=A0A0A2TDF9_9BACI|nr:CAP domain-containing protein [Pontibacillus yanchengensis]KGP72458.1 membrane protein [Pontibacillus yanchengensis Y32]